MEAIPSLTVKKIKDHRQFPRLQNRGGPTAQFSKGWERGAEEMLEASRQDSGTNRSQPGGLAGLVVSSEKVLNSEPPPGLPPANQLAG